MTTSKNKRTTFWSIQSRIALWFIKASSANVKFTVLSIFLWICAPHLVTRRPTVQNAHFSTFCGIFPTATQSHYKSTNCSKRYNNCLKFNLFIFSNNIWKKLFEIIIIWKKQLEISYASVPPVSAKYCSTYYIFLFSNLRLLQMFIVCTGWRFGVFAFFRAVSSVLLTPSQPSRPKKANQSHTFHTDLIEKTLHLLFSPQLNINPDWKSTCFGLQTTTKLFQARSDLRTETGKHMNLLTAYSTSWVAMRVKQTMLSKIGSERFPDFSKRKSWAWSRIFQSMSRHIRNFSLWFEPNVISFCLMSLHILRNYVEERLNWL